MQKILKTEKINQQVFHHPRYTNPKEKLRQEVNENYGGATERYSLTQGQKDVIRATVDKQQPKKQTVKYVFIF